MEGRGVFMKTIIWAILFAAFSSSWAEVPCRDINCYFEREAKQEEQRRREEDEKLRDYRGQQIQLQEEEVGELTRQNNLMEEQVEILRRQEDIASDHLKIEQERAKKQVQQ